MHYIFIIFVFIGTRYHTESYDTEAMMQSTIMNQYNMQTNENHQLNHQAYNKQEQNSHHYLPASNTASQYYNDGRMIFLAQPNHLNVINDSSNKQADANANSNNIQHLNATTVQKMDMNNNSQYLDNQNDRNGSNGRVDVKEENHEDSNSSSLKQQNEDDESVNKTVIMDNIKNDNDSNKEIKVGLKEEEQAENNEAISENLMTKKEKIELDDAHTNNSSSNESDELINVNKKLKLAEGKTEANGDSSQYISAYESEPKSESSEIDNIMENNAHNASIASTN